MALLEECAACRFGLADFFVKSFILYAIYKYNCLCVRVCVCVSFRLPLPKPLKTKRIKTQAVQQVEQQLTLAADAVS